MAACTFFGHRDISKEAEPFLRHILIDLIKNKDVDTFYVGTQGNFDYMVIDNLKSLKLIYKQIKFIIVLAYMPYKKENMYYSYYSDVIYPPELKDVHPKYAIVNRNQWMINKSDYVVTYVVHSWGGAAKFKKIAEKKGKVVINIADFNF